MSGKDTVRKALYRARDNALVNIANLQAEIIEEGATERSEISLAYENLILNMANDLIKLCQARSRF